MTPRRSWLAAFVLGLWLGAVSLGSVEARAQGLPAEIGGEVALGKNLTDDACVLRRQNPDAWGAKSERYAIFCEGWTEPSGLLVRLPGNTQPVSWWIDASAWAAGLRAGGECEDPKPETRIEGFEAMTRKCLARQGWRRMMLAAHAGTDIFAADFLPNNATLIERALMVAANKAKLDAPPQGQRLAALNALEEMAGKDVPLVSIKNIAQLQNMSRLGNSQFEAREYRKAEQTQGQVLEIQERLVGLQSPALAMTLLHMSDAVRDQRRLNDADALADRAGKLAAKSGDPILIAYHLWTESNNAVTRGKYDQGIAFAQKSVAVISPFDKMFPTASGQAFASLGAAYLYNQNYAEADAAARRAFKTFNDREGEASVWGNRARMVLIKTLVAEHKLAEAKPLVDSTLAAAEKYFGRTIWWATAKAIEGEYYRAAGDDESALQSYRQFAQVSAHQNYACLFAPCLPPLIELLLKKAGSTSDQTLLSEAFAAAQLWDSPVINTAIGQMAARASLDDPKLQDFVRAQQDLDESQAEIRAELSAEAVLPADQRSPQKEADLTSQLQAAVKKVADNELLLQDRFPRYAQLLSRVPIDARRIGSLLGPDEGLLYVALLGREGFTFLLQHGRISVHPISLSSDDVQAKVERLRQGVMVPDGLTLPEFDEALAHQMFTDLVGDLLDKAPEVKRLVFVPSGALLSLPPDLLIMKPPAKGSPPDWLARHYAILVAPDVRSLERLRGVAKPQALGTSFFGIGNPSFAGSAKPGAVPKATGPCAEHRNVRAEIAGLPPLPDSEDEVRAMSAALGQSKSEILLHDRARKSALRTPAFSSADIVAFATHGLLPADLYCEDEPSLALAPGTAPDDDGLLRASEVSVMRLKADLVVLSACNTAGADGRLSGEALSGLVRAFFFAGARNVLATHWSIASKQTVALTTGMISRAAKGIPLAEALQSAKLDLMNAKDTAHPIFWAAFTLVGGG